MKLVLDLLFVLVFHWGVWGAGFATSIAQWLSVSDSFVCHDPGAGKQERIRKGMVSAVRTSMLYGFFRAIEKPGMSVVLTVVSLGLRVILAYGLSAVRFIGVTGIWVPPRSDG